jgi:hypothetical protein
VIRTAERVTAADRQIHPGEFRTLISLYAHVKGIGMYKAAKELQEQFGTAHAPGSTCVYSVRARVV